MSTSLGIHQGNDHADFVFGQRSDSNGLSFRFAQGLNSLESLAQQQLDFIQRLYLKQARPGEFFQEIHLAGSGVTSPSAAKSVSPVHECQTLLSELLQAWVNDNELKLKIANHRELSIQNRKTFLHDHELVPNSLALKEFNLTDAYTLWSMAYPGTPDSFSASGYKTFKTLDYQKIDNLALPNFLNDYKQELIWKFNATKYSDYDCENERHYLITLAEDSETTRHELLACQESIIKLLERKIVTDNRLDENATAANDPLTEDELEIPVASESYATGYATQHSSGRIAALPQMHNANAQLAIDMDMDRTAEIPADLTNDLTAEIDDELAAELTAEVTADVSAEMINGLTAEAPLDVPDDNLADTVTPENTTAGLPEETQTEKYRSEQTQVEKNRSEQNQSKEIQLQAPVGQTIATAIPTELAIEQPAYVAPTIGGRQEAEEKNWQQPNARRARLLDASLFGLAVMAAIGAAYYLSQKLQ